LILLQLGHVLSPIHGLEISLQLLKSTRVNPEFMREKNQRRDTAPQRKISILPEHRPADKTNTHTGCSRAHSVRAIGAARSHCLSSSWMRIVAVAQAANGKPQECIHPSIHPSIIE
jgi:hypothetical protein